MRYVVFLVLAMAATLGCGSTQTCSQVIDPATPDDGGTIRPNALDTPIMLYDGTMIVIPPGGRVEAGSAAIQSFQAPDGSTITGVSWDVAPDPHTSIDGIGLGSLQLYRVGLDVRQKVLLDAATPIGDRVSDTSQSAAEYSQPHSISVNLNEEATDELYIVYFSQEAGGGAAVGGVVFGATVKYRMP